MDENRPKPELYPLPYTVRSRWKWYTHLLVLVFIIGFGACVLMPWDDSRAVLLHFLGPALSAFFLVMWLYIGVFRRVSLTVDDQGIVYKTFLTRKKQMLWSDIANIQSIVQNHTSGIGISTQKKLQTLGEKGSVARLLFTGAFDLTILKSIFPDTDLERLYTTMFARWQAAVPEMADDNGAAKPGESTLEAEPDGPAEFEDAGMTGGSGPALLLALLASLLTAVVYGCSLYFLHKNYLIIPTLGMLLILAAYLFKQKHQSFPARLLLGLFCALPVFAGIYLDLMLETHDNLHSLGLWELSSAAFSTLAQPSSDFVVVYTLAAILFLSGVFLGASFRFMRRLKQPFLRKLNGFPTERKDHTLRIYLSDYTAYDENAGHFSIRFFPGSCFIEKRGRTPLALYLPAETLNKSGVHQESLVRTRIVDTDYYKLDLGGGGEPVPYGLDCLVRCDKNRGAALIELDLG